jgi:hypothetical protein
MKATIEFDDDLYRRLKIEAARRGSTIRELVAEGVRSVLGETPAVDYLKAGESKDWIGMLREYAPQAGGRHDLSAMRESIVRERGRKDE